MVYKNSQIISTGDKVAIWTISYLINFRCKQKQFFHWNYLVI